MAKVFKLLNEVRKDEAGVTMAEYAILLGLIAVVSIGIITTVGTDILNVFTNVSYPTRKRHLRCSRYSAKCAKMRKGLLWPSMQFSLASSAAVPNAH